MPLIGGEVRDSSGELAVGRGVRVYRRDTGELLGKTNSSDGAGVADPFFSSVSLLLHCDGAEGSNVVIDSSATPNIVTVAGNAFQTAENKFFGANSLKIVDYTGLVSVPAGAALDFGTGDFTVEAMCRYSGTRYQSILSNTGPENNSGFVLLVTNTENLRLRIPARGLDITSSAIITPNVNHHVAVSRQSDFIRVFLDGVKVIEAIYLYEVLSVHRFFVGAFENYDLWNFDGGFVGEVRVTKGVARYIADFTPLTAPHPDLTSAVPLGRYALSINYSGEVQVICLGEDSGGVVRNDMIHRSVPV